MCVCGISPSPTTDTSTGSTRVSPVRRSTSFFQRKLSSAMLPRRSIGFTTSHVALSASICISTISRPVHPHIHDRFTSPIVCPPCSASTGREGSSEHILIISPLLKCGVAAPSGAHARGCAAPTTSIRSCCSLKPRGPNTKCASAPPSPAPYPGG